MAQRFQNSTRFDCGNRSEIYTCDENIRRFIVQSKENLTYYSNCDGAYERRIVKKDKRVLEELLYTSVFYNQGPLSSGTDPEKTRIVKSFAQALIQRNTNTDDEEPVFKLFRNKTGKDAVFLDCRCKYYENWNEFLNNTDIFNSFLCVPRNGEYVFSGDRNILDLEFLRARKDCIRLYRGNIQAKYSPFCNAIRTIFQKLKEVGQGIKRAIKSMAIWVSNFVVKHKWIIVGVAVAVTAVAFAVGTFVPLPNFLSESFLVLASGSSSILSSVTKFGISPDSSTTEPGMEFPQAVKEKGVALSKHISNIKGKTWKPVLKGFSALYRECRPYLCTLTSLFPKPLQFLMHILDITFLFTEDKSGDSCAKDRFSASILSKLGGNNSIKGSSAEDIGNLMRKLGDNNSTKGSSAEDIGNLMRKLGDNNSIKGSSAENNGNLMRKLGDNNSIKGSSAEDIGNLMRTLGSNNSKEDSSDEYNLRVDAVIDALVDNPDLLGNGSCRNLEDILGRATVDSQLVAKPLGSGLGGVKKFPDINAILFNSDILVLLLDNKKEVMVIMPNATFAGVINALTQFLGTPLTLKIQEKDQIEVINSQGLNLGQLFIPLNSVVVGLFQLQVVPEERRKELTM